jgi:hypothetical protein
MNPILQALASGYGVDKILKYLSKSNPTLTSKIAQATNAGHTANEILKYIMKGGKSISEYLPDASSSDNNLYNKMQYNVPKHVQAGLDFVGGLGKAGIALGVASKINSSLNQQNQPQTQPNQPTAPVNTILPNNPTPPTNPVQPGLGIGQQMQQNVSPNIQQPPQQPAQATQSIIPPAQSITPPAQPAIPSSQALQNIGALKQVHNMLDANNPPEVIADIVNSTLKGDARKSFGQMLKSGQVKPLIDMVKDVQQERELVKSNEPVQMPDNRQQEQMTEQQIIEQEPEAIQEMQPEQKKPIEKKPIVKGSIVSTPQGVGEVKGISNGKSIVEIDGKAHNIDEKDLERAEFSDEDVAKAYNHLMMVIPEPHKSSWIQWAGYDEDRNTLGFISKDGKYEELHNISPREAEIIKKGEGVARTSGETREGIWSIGEDTRGGVVSQIIWDRKKKNEDEEEKQLKFDLKLPKKEKEKKGMQPIYSEMGYARKKSRERDKAIKLAEKERLKKEKDEAKKRKK